MTVVKGVVFLIVCIVFLSVSFAYIFHPNFTIRYRKSNYFGFSVLLQKGETEFRVIVGDPKADSVYYCSGNNNNCTLKFQSPLVGFNDLLGATITGGDTYNDSVIICSPRYSRLYRANGRCYISFLNRKKLLAPLSNDHLQVKNFNGTNEYFYAHGQAGFSAKYIKENNDILLGAPGLLSWKGSFIVHQSNSMDFVFNSEYKVDKDSYLGYSVEYGVFPYRGRRKIHVVGAPRGGESKGEVFLFEYDFYTVNTLKIFESDQLGSYFGSSLLVSPRNDYKISDLIIGAPMYVSKSFEEGCIFVYNSNLHDIFLESKICGTRRGGRFGTAMTKLGDINSDFYEDIAVSAPYENDGRGSVYIYVGSLNGFKLNEKITAESIDDNLRSFGFSLSNAIDVDDNDNNDIAVGAYKSSQVIILKSRTLLKFSGNIYPDVDRIQNNTRKFSLPYCITYKSYKMTGNINTTVTASTDYRANIPNSIVDLSLTIGVTYCSEFLVQLKPHAFDSPLPLSIRIVSKLEECTSCPVAHPEDNILTKQIPFVTGCGDDDICRPQLKIEAHFENQLPYVIGSKELVSFMVNIQNQGDSAYLCKLNVSMLPDVKKLPPKCSKQENQLRCDIANNFRSNQKKILRFEMDTLHMNAMPKEIKIQLAVGSNGEGDGKIAKTELTLPISYISNLLVNGFSAPEYLLYAEGQETVTFVHEYSLFNAGPSPLLDYRSFLEIPQNFSINENVVSIFEIDTNLEECQFDSQRPKHELSKRSIADSNSTAHRKGFKEIPINCSNELVECRKYVCMEGQLNANTTKRFSFTLTGNVTSLANFYFRDFTQKDVIVINSMFTVTANVIYAANISTHLRREGEKETMGFWLWIISIIVAVIILYLIIFILYKLHFFSRPMREKLINEEEESIKDNAEHSESTSED